MRTVFANCSAIAGAVLVAALAAGCGATRQSTTARTAVEQALLTRTTRESVDGMKVPEVSGKSFAVKAEGFDTPEKHFALSSMTELLLRSDGRLAQGETVPDLDIEPRVDCSQIDDGSFFIGIPAIPVPLPGVGTIQTPELALFKRETQKARTRFSMYGVERKDGSLAFTEQSPWSTRYYARWKLFIVIGFRTTDLEKPF